MAKREKSKTYYVTGKMILEICIPVTANSLEDAISASKSLDVHDFVTIQGDYNDGEMKINGVFEQYKKIEL